MLLYEQVTFFATQVLILRLTICRSGPLRLHFCLLLVAIRFFSLAARSACAVQAPDGVPIQIAVEVHAPVSGDEDARSERPERVYDFLNERSVVRGFALHSVEKPFPAKDIEGGLESIRHGLEMRRSLAVPVALGQRRAADNSILIPKWMLFERILERIPFLPEERHGLDFPRVALELVVIRHDALVATVPREVLEQCDFIRGFCQVAIASALSVLRRGKQTGEWQDVRTRLAHRGFDGCLEMMGDMLRLVREYGDSLQQDFHGNSISSAQQLPLAIFAFAKVALSRRKSGEEKEDAGRAGIVTVKRKKP